MIKIFVRSELDGCHLMAVYNDKPLYAEKFWADEDFENVCDKILESFKEDYPNEEVIIIK